MTDNLVVLVADKLIAKDIDPVWYENPVAVYQTVKLHSSRQLLEKADKVDILRRCKLHPRNRPATATRLAKQPASSTSLSL